jgi:hypothetical protein
MFLSLLLGSFLVLLVVFFLLKLMFRIVKENRKKENLNFLKNKGLILV